MHKFWPPLAICGSLLVIALMFVGTEAAPVTYYVSPTGNDKNAGTLLSPWKTLQKAANTVTAGNTVVVLAGTYNERVKFNTRVNHSGVSGSPVIFKSETPQVAIVTGGFDTRNANYLVIDGFKITTTVKGSTGGGVLVGSNNVVIANNYFYNIPDAAVRGYNSTAITPTDVVVKNNSLIGNQFGIIAVGNRWLVEGNELTLKRFITGDLDYIQFAGNDLTFRHNYLHGTSFADKSTATVNGWQANVPSGKTFANIEISGNLVESFDEGVGLAGVTTNSFNNVTIFNNVFNGLFSERANTGGYGVYAKKYLTGLNITHNTFANLSAAGVRVSNSSVATVQNNIFYKSTNNYYLDTKAVIVGGHNLLGLTTKTTFKDTTDIINPEPLFINSASLLGADLLPYTADDGFSLQGSSPAINQALASSLNLDLTGAPRPSGPASDLGAYEAVYVNLDKTPPLTVVTPAGGIYTTAQAIFFQTNELAKTYYCFDLVSAKTPCLPATEVSGAVNLKDSGILRFYSVDQVGNKEQVRSESYTLNLDVTPPITSVYPPAGAYPLNTSISFLRNEIGSTFYCLAANCTPTLPYTVALNLTAPIALRFYSVDQVGNKEAVKEENYTLTIAASTTTTEVITEVVETATTTTAATTTETKIILLSGNSGDAPTKTVAGGGVITSIINLATSSLEAATTTLTGISSDLTSLSIKVVELQKVLINLLQQLIQKGREVSDLAAESLAAVGSLFLQGFTL